MAVLPVRRRHPHERGGVVTDLDINPARLLGLWFTAAAVGLAVVPVGFLVVTLGYLT